jgi:hypothetical protein
MADPVARWTAASRECAFFAYATNYLIDRQHAVIVDIEATTAIRQVEVTARCCMIDRTQERFFISSRQPGSRGAAAAIQPI